METKDLSLLSLLLWQAGEHIDQPHLSVVCGEGVENLGDFLILSKLLLRKRIAKNKAIDLVWKTFTFSVENYVESLYKTRCDRGERY